MDNTAGMQEAQLLRFCRQYSQLESVLTYPDDFLLKQERIQNLLFHKLFRPGAMPYHPPPRFQLKVLKELVARIEAAIDDWDKYGLSDNLMGVLSCLMARPLPSEVATAQRKCYVTYHLSLLEAKSNGENPSITLLESRSLISAFGTTGLRTWEAALHLGQYLCTHRTLVSMRHVLELGAGTGYLSILCAKHLSAARVIASDGSDEVINHLPNNFFVNGLQNTADKIVPMDLKWGHALLGTEDPEWNGGQAIDLVIGADITFDERLIPALVATLVQLALMFPGVIILIAATERNKKTFDCFLSSCKGSGFVIEPIDFPVLPSREQTGPFYDYMTSIRICQLIRFDKNI